MSGIRSQATPARDELAEAMKADLLEANGRNELLWYDNDDYAFADLDAITETLLAAGWSKPRTVNSAGEAEALEEGSVILTGGMASIALTDLNQPVRVWDAGHGAQCTTDRLTFPATVLFTPGEAG